MLLVGALVLLAVAGTAEDATEGRKEAVDGVPLAVGENGTEDGCGMRGVVAVVVVEEEEDTASGTAASDPRLSRNSWVDAGVGDCTPWSVTGRADCSDTCAM